MNSFSRLTAATAIFGATVIASTAITEVRTLALPDDQVAQKMQQIPVFAITDDKGVPLVANIKNQQGNQTFLVTGVFFSQKDAKDFMGKVKKQNPAVTKNVQVTPVPLSEIYKLAQSNQSKKEKLTFDLLPKAQQVASAESLLRKSGVKIDKFAGVPLFFATGGKDEGYLTIQRNNQVAIPFYFEKEQIESIVDNFKKQKPELASTVKIRVLALEGLIETMKKKNDPQLSQVVLIPSTESIQFLQSIQPTPGKTQPTRANNQRTNNAPRNQPKKR